MWHIPPGTPVHTHTHQHTASSAVAVSNCSSPCTSSPPPPRSTSSSCASCYCPDVTKSVPIKFQRVTELTKDPPKGRHLDGCLYVCLHMSARLRHGDQPGPTRHAQLHLASATVPVRQCQTRKKAVLGSVSVRLSARVSASTCL